MTASERYLGYDRAELDAQYFLRARVPDHRDFFAAYAARSAEARATLPCRLDVAYGPSPAERLDIFPAGDGAPVHVFIHGGYWMAFDAHDFDYVAFGLVPRGAAAVIVNYALAPAVTLDEIVRQNRAALAWVWRHAGSFGGDPGRIFVSGHSAGGHLVAMMMASDWPAIDPVLPSDLVKGGVAVSGLFDLEPVRRCYLNETLGLDPAAARRNSPLHHLPARAIPLVLCVGELETDEFHRQQAALATTWAARGYPLQIVDAPGLHHFSVIDELARPGSPLNHAALSQMGLAARPSEIA